jgi:hypothetical protein
VTSKKDFRQFFIVAFRYITISYAITSPMICRFTLSPRIDRHLIVERVLATTFSYFSHSVNSSTSAGRASLHHFVHNGEAVSPFQFPAHYLL